MLIVCFFFKQKTAYEMRISDWSSDVCSSDLLPVDPDDPQKSLPEGIEAQTRLAFENLQRIVAHAGYALADTVFARVYLTDFKRDYPGMNRVRSEEHTSELQSLMRISYAVFCLKKKTNT